MKRIHDRDAVTALSAASARVRHKALVTLGKLDKTALSPHASAIACVLADPNKRVRSEAVMTLGKLEHGALAPYVAAIVELLADSGARVRHAAALTLGNMESAERTLHERAIVRFLLYPDEGVVHGVRHSAVAALGGLDALLTSNCTVGLLVDKINSSAEFAREYTRVIVDMLANPCMRYIAIRLLASGRIGMRAPDMALACSAVTNMLTDANDDIRYSAAKALRKLKRQRARLNWATARVYRVRWYGRFWYEYCEKLCAPGGVWAERDRAAFEKDFI